MELNSPLLDLVAATVTDHKRIVYVSDALCDECGFPPFCFSLGRLPRAVKGIWIVEQASKWVQKMQMFFIKRVAALKALSVPVSSVSGADCRHVYCVIGKYDCHQWPTEYRTCFLRNLRVYRCVIARVNSVKQCEHPMASAVKKTSTRNAISEYDKRFEAIRTSAERFNTYELNGHSLLYASLDEIFTFGRDISKRGEIFETFLKQRRLKFNKVTKENPYNALVELAFGNQKSKSWRSELSSVLAYATVSIGNAAFIDWIKEGGVKGRYDQAVEYFRQKKGKNASSVRATQLASIQSSLQKEPLSPQPISGLPQFKQGFHRSLVYSDGVSTFLVDIKDEEGTTEVEKYLLELARKRGAGVHPLQSRPLFGLYRAISLIVGACASISKGKRNFIRFRNSTVENGTTTTTLDFVSDAYTFTHATTTLAAPIAELGDNGAYILEIDRAKEFADHFPSDYYWSVSGGNGEIRLFDDSPEKRVVTLSQLTPDVSAPLRQGQALKMPSRHFTAIAVDMKQSLENLPALCSGKPAPKSLSWDINSNQMQLISPNHALLRLDFLRPLSKIEEIGKGREFSMADLTAFIESVTLYGEDLSGYIADSDEKNAAFCIDHQWIGGDRFRYVSPFIISKNLDTTMVCEELHR